MAQSSSFLALLINRVGDFLLFCFLFFDGGLFFVVSVITKSSILIFCSWLPNAMEGPTPVSSLLHSSTMVVAGVLMLSFFGFFGWFFGFLGVFFGCFLGFFGGFFKDFKRIIAYSTSSQLVLIGILFCLGHFLGGVSYIVTHARFKAFLFIFCGIIIHAGDIQLTGVSHINHIFWGIFCILVFGIMGGPFLFVSFSKDDFLLGFFGVRVFFVSLFGCSTIFYSLTLVSFLGGGFLGLGFFGGLGFFVVFQSIYSLGLVLAREYFLGFFGSGFLFILVFCFLLGGLSYGKLISVDFLFFDFLKFFGGTFEFVLMGFVLPFLFFGAL